MYSLNLPVLPSSWERLRRLLGRVLLLAALLALLRPGPAAAAQARKDRMYDQMYALAAELQALKPSLPDPQVAAAYQAKLELYGQISAQLGGDDPAHMAGGTARDHASRARKVVKSAPAAPPSCSTANGVFTQSTAVAIPTGPAVVTSTVVVSGMGPYLWDLDVTTFIRHTFAADLDVTIQSPAGTVVTLTTDNGGNNDDVFNGTVWDDDADPAGQVPYATNDGLVTDHAYVNLTTATPLVPEEPLDAFRGENPNGTWTITVSDDSAGDGGSLDSWSLDVTTLAAAPANTAGEIVDQTTPLAIPTGPAVVSNTVSLSGTVGMTICSVALTTNITHTFNADLDITLMSPAGTIVTLTSDNGGNNDNVFNGTEWRDNANPAGQVPNATNDGTVTDQAYVNLVTATPLTPEESFGAFRGENAAGTWTMTVSDDSAGDGGSLDSWALDVTSCSCATSADVSVAKDDGATTVTPGALVTYTIVVSNAGPDPTNNVNVVDSFPAMCTGPTYTSIPSGGATGNTASGSGNINDLVNMPVGSTVTYTASCTLSPSATGTLANMVTASGGSATQEPNPNNNSSTDTDTIVAGANIAGTKTVSGSFTEGGAITYTVVLTNNGNAAQADNPGAELTDVLPAQLQLVSASADSGSAVATTATNTVTWNGTIGIGAAVTITIHGTIQPGTAGMTINNQGTIAYDSDGNGTNDATRLTDDPGQPGAADPTPLVVTAAATAAIPTVSFGGLLLLVGLLAAVGALTLRRPF